MFNLSSISLVNCFKREIGEIGNSLEAEVSLWVEERELHQFLESYLPKLPVIFIVSSVKLELVETLPKDAVLDSELPKLGGIVSKTLGKKCERCWNWSQSVGVNLAHPQICSRCLRIIGGGS